MKVVDAQFAATGVAATTIRRSSKIEDVTREFSKHGVEKNHYFIVGPFFAVDERGLGSVGVLDGGDAVVVVVGFLTDTATTGGGRGSGSGIFFMKEIHHVIRGAKVLHEMVEEVVWSTGFFTLGLGGTVHEHADGAEWGGFFYLTLLASLFSSKELK